MGRTRLGRQSVALSATLCCAAALVACTTSEASPGADPPRPAGSATASLESQPPSTPAEKEPVNVVLRTDRGRQSQGVIAAGGGDAPYNYAPAVMSDGGRFRLWWCSQLSVAVPGGDDVLYAESASPDGGFSPATPVYSGSGAGFDAMHTCDPSVLLVGGTYYMYYGGSDGNPTYGTSIGLATSPDGRVWTRANGGRPIVVPARNQANPNLYGAGQPAAVYLDGWFYLMFTDTTGNGVGENGSGQFLLRSKDPAFAAGVEALAPGGFRPVPDTSARLRSVAGTFGVDLMWVDALDAFAIASQTHTPDGTLITFWDKGFRVNPYQPVHLAGPWREGPGLVRRADGHAVVPLDSPCDTVPLDLVRGTREGQHGPTDLMHFGLDLVGVDACRTARRALLTLNGYAMPSPKRTIDLVDSGKVVRIERRSVAEVLAVRILDRRLPVLDEVPVAAEITPTVPAVRADGRGVGLLLDGKLWPVVSAQVAERNSSVITDISPAAWDAYPRGSAMLAPPPR